MHRFTRWLKRYWWLVLAAGVVGATVAFATTTRVDVYQARALVVATQPSVPETEVGAVLISIGVTNAVLDPTVDELGLDVAPHSLATSGSLTVQPGASDLAVNVVGSARDPGLAIDLANAGAQNLADAAKTNGFGAFSVFPWEGEAVVRKATIALSLLGGALLAIATVIALAAAWAALRRPALGGTAAAVSDVTYRLEVEPSTNDSKASIVRPDVVAAAWASLRAAATDRGEPVTIVPVRDGARSPWDLDAVITRFAGLSESDGHGEAYRTWSPGSSDGDQPPSRTVALIASSETPLGRLIDVRRDVDPSREAFVALMLVTRS